jgi:ATP-dependent Lon protease
VKNPIKIKHEMEELPEDVRQSLAFVCVAHIQEARATALELKIPIRRKEN